MKKLHTLFLAFLFLGITTTQAQITNLFTFTGTTGAYKGGYGFGDAGPIVSGGVVYGVTKNNGAYGFGVIFSYNIATQVYTDLYDFEGLSYVNSTTNSGKNPYGTLAISSSGLVLYGNCQSGGANNKGYIFQINTDGTGFTDIYDFQSATGWGPSGSGVIISGNILYGAAYNGGAHNQGVIWSYNVGTSTYTDLHDFFVTNDHGQQPLSTPILSGGVLYGLATNYGPGGCVYSLNVSTQVFASYNFNNGNPNGEDGWGGKLAISTDGLTLYGVDGGANGGGSGYLFSIGTNLTGFTALTNGSFSTPCQNGVILYGTKLMGGVGSNNGTLYSYDLNTHTMSTIVTFNSSTGDDPYGTLFGPYNGLFYGLTQYLNTYGNLYSYQIPCTLTTTASTTTNVSCNGGNNGSATATPASGATPYTYAWSNGTSTVSTSNPTGTVLSAGSYTVTVQDANSCTATATVAITQPTSALSATASVTANAACNGNNGSAQEAVSGGTSPYTYAWSNSTTSSSISATAATYTVTVQDNHGCSATGSVTITQPAATTPVITSTNGTTFCSSGSTTLGTQYSGNDGINFSGTAYCTIPEAAGLDFGASTDFTVEGWINCTASQGNYSGLCVKATIGGGNPFWQLVLVNNQIAAEFYSSSGSIGTANGLEGGPALNDGNWHHVAMTVTRSTNTIVLYVDGTAQATVVNSVVGGSITSTGPVYLGVERGANIHFNGTEDEFRIWNYAKSQAQIQAQMHTAVAKNAANLVAYYRMDDGTGTTATDLTGNGHTATFVNSPTWVPSTAPVGQYGAYTWSNSATTYTTTASSAGTYTVSVTDVNGCSGTGSIVLNTTTVAANITSTNVTCSGNNNGSAQSAPSGGASPYTYAWQGGATTSSISNLSAGTYTLTVHDNGGCSGTGTVTITAPTALLANVTVTANATACANTGAAQSTPSGGTSPYTYAWLGGATTSSISSLSAGTYTLTIQDNNSCSATASLSITAPSALSLGGGSINVDATVIGGFGGQNFNITTTHANELILVAYDGFGPFSSSAGTVTVNGNNATYINGANNANANSEVWAYAAPTAGTYTISCSETGFTTYVYYNNMAQAVYEPGTSLSLGNIVNSVTGTGTSVTSFGTGITVASNNTYVFGNFSFEQTNSTENGNPTLTGISTATQQNVGQCCFQWDNAAIGGSSLAAGTYTITGTDLFTGKGATTLVAIQPTSIAAITVNSNASACANSGSATANAGGGTSPYTYVWSNSATTSSISSLSAATYTLTVHDNNGCSATGNVTITAPAALAANATVTANVACNGGNGTAQAAPAGGTSPYTYAWSNSATTLSISATAGTYTLTVHDNNGCSATGSIAITQPSAALASNATVTSNVLCNGGNGTAQSVPTGGTSPYTYSWQGGATTSSITASANTYSLTVQDNHGCSATASVTITQAPSVTASTTLISNSIACSNTGSASVTPGGGNTPYTYLWSDASSQTNATASNLSGGSYTVTVTDNNNCSATASVTITQAPSVTASNTLISNSIACSNTGSASVTPGGGDAPYTYLWSDASSQTNATASNLSGGSYTVTVTDNNNCSATASVTITQAPSVTASTTLISNSIACSNTGSASVTPGGGDAPYTYLWSDASSQTNATASNLSGGSYTVSVTDNNNCSATASVTITQAPSVTASTTLISNSIACSNTGSASVTPGGGDAPYTYLWSDASSQTNATASNLSGGSYTVTVTDNNNCSATASVIITQAPSVTASTHLISNSIACSNTGSASVTPGGGDAPYTYLWSDASSQTNATASNLSGGSYTVTVTDNNNCSATASVIITQAPSVTASTHLISNSIACSNTGSASVTPGGGNTPYTYLWSDASSQTNATASNLSGGSYTVTVTDNNNCSATASVTITQAPSVTASTTLISNSIACSNTGSASVTPGGGNTPYTYLWSDASSQTNATASNLSGGSYTVTVTDNNNCSATASVTITQAPSVTASTTLISNSIACSNTGSASVTPGGGNTPYAYLWSDASSQTNATASNLSGGSYTVTVTDNNNCSATASVTITQAPSVTASTHLISNSIACSNTGSASVTPGGGNAPYQYLWSDNSSQTTATASNLSGGSYTVTVTDNNNCSATASVTITQAPSVTASTTLISNSIACSNTGSASVTPGGGNTPYTYLWSDASSQTNATASNLSGGSYTVTVTDNNNCSASASVIITQAPAVTASTTLISNSIACSNTGSASVIPGGGDAPYTYLWSDASSQTNATASNLSGGSYTVTVTDNNNCSATASVTITQAPSVTASGSTATNVLCNGGNNGSGSVTAGGADAPYTYAWSNGETTSSISSLTAGVYTVTVTDNNNCSATASITISEPNTLTASGVVTTSITCYGNNNGAGNVNVSGGTAPYTYSWSNGATTSSISSLTANTYTVLVTDNNNCSASAGFIITQPVHLSTTATVLANVSCNGGTDGNGQANANGGTSPYTYTWSNGSSTVSTSNPTGTILTAGSYTVTVQDNCGASVSASIIITQPFSITATASATAEVSCNGGSNGNATAIPLGGTSPYNYVWSNGSSTVSTSNPSGPVLSAGSYTVTVTDNCGAGASASVTISEPNALSTGATVTANVTCYGASTGSATANVSGGTSPFTYTWSNGTSTVATSNPTGAVLSAGSYTVTVQDSCGSSATASITISQPNPLFMTAAVTANIGCFGGNTGNASAFTNGGTLPYTYTWSNGSSTVSNSNPTGPILASGSYTVTVLDNCGTSATASISVTQPTQFQYVSAGLVSNVTCYNGTNGSVTVNPVGGNPPYTYAWNNASTTVSTTQTAAGLSAGTYTITVQDNCGITKTSTATINQPAPLRDSISFVSNILCNGGNGGSASVGVRGGNYPYLYTWSPGGSTLASISNLTAGSYTVTVTDQNGCTTTNANQVATITQPAVVRDSVVSINTPLCYGQKGSITVGVKGGLAPYIYFWSPAVSTTSTASSIAAGTYTITIKDAHRCASQLVVTLTQPGAIRDSMVAAAKVNVSCNGANNGSATVGVKYGTSPYTYHWTPNVGSTATVSNLSAGMYSVTVTDKNGCLSATASVNITQPALLRDSVSLLSAVGCYGGSGGQISVGTRGGTQPYTYAWSNAKTTYSISGLSAGIYTVTITDHGGCSNTLSVTVTQPAQIISTITDSCLGYAQARISARVTGGITPYTYKWSNGKTTSTMNVANGTYTITVKDAHGCSETNTVTSNCPNTPSAPPSDGPQQNPPTCCQTLKDVNLYPNPNTGQFTISGLDQGMTIEVFDYTGRRVSIVSASDITMHLNIADQPNGIYLVRITDKDGSIVAQKKVIKTQ